ncbi:ferredoxin--NADP reductase [Sediminibacterium roseum]|uniref:Ferredoxin--NADP reductase n=1 Tax=Sediminibacterium roseum TaxID=1978412 RepID=A0ABW9ZYE0_9BACT|nr:ferredoxin--NADP reductase [Sediminibacterium roseum]NCI51274.1 ferredoxin--NADP reductase [Sediminibacterium roseum]
MDDVSPKGVFPLRIRKIIEETGDAKSFVLETVDGKPLQYTAGQFLTFVFNKDNGKQERRNYSLSSLPGSEPVITVKRIPNGEYSRFLFDHAKEGDLLQTIGASGFFTLPGNRTSYRQYVFFAAGSGITPVMALAREILSHAEDTKVLLVYSNRSLDSAIYYKQLLELQEQHANRFRIDFLFSDAAHVEQKRMGVYVLEKILAEHVLQPVSEQIYYLCGPFEYMRMITIILKNNGVPAAQIRRETFTIEVPAHKPQPADQDEHTIHVTLSDKTYRFKSRYPQTILQAAKAVQIPMPFSCEAGQCGTCAATCISGNVFMWRNDVLLDEEIAKGRVLTCTGYAVGGDVVLQV